MMNDNLLEPFERVIESSKKGERIESDISLEVSDLDRFLEFGTRWSGRGPRPHDNLYYDKVRGWIEKRVSRYRENSVYLDTTTLHSAYTTSYTLSVSAVGLDHLCKCGRSF
jgi:hypothetical protein